MIEFISKNYEWLFSGIGVFLLSLLFIFLKKKRISSSTQLNKDTTITLKDNNNNQVQVIDKQVKVKYDVSEKVNVDHDFIKYNPIQIKEKILSSPLFQQNQIANNYVGLKVKWNLFLFHIHKGERNIVTVAMSENKNNSFPDINFEIDINDYPTLKIANEGSQFQVIGTITKCEAYHIYIELDEIKAI